MMSALKLEWKEKVLELKEKHGSLEMFYSDKKPRTFSLSKEDASHRSASDAFITFFACETVKCLNTMCNIFMLIFR